VRSVARVAQVLGLLVVALLVVASLGSILAGHPFLLEVEESNSMYPRLQRGDVALVLPASGSTVHVGDIVLYRPQRGALQAEGFIVHRIVGGDARYGYVTKGDANALSDQASGMAPPIPGGWIDGVVPTIGGQPLRVPLVGFLAIWIGAHLQHLYILPALGGLFTVVLAVSGSDTRAKRRRRRHSEEMLLGVLTLAVVLSVLTAAITLVTSQHDQAPYAVGITTGALSASSLGVLKAGETTHVTASKLSNRGFFPLAVAVTSTDRNLTFTPRDLWLLPGDQARIVVTVHAVGTGVHDSPTWIGLFPPFLPPALLWWLAERSFWLALCVVSLTPMLPFVLYLILVRRLRAAGWRLARRAVRPLSRVLP